MIYNWTDEDWKAFRKKFPEALFYLEKKSLLNELCNLLRRSTLFELNDWESMRLKELRDWSDNEFKESVKRIVDGFELPSFKVKKGSSNGEV